MTSTSTEPSAPAAGSRRPPLVAFHRMGHAAGQTRYRPLIGMVAVLVGAVGVLYGPDLLAPQWSAAGQLPGFGPLTDLVRSLIQVALVLPIVLVVTRWIGGRPVGTLLSVTGRVRSWWLGICLMAASVATILMFVASIALTVATPDLPASTPNSLPAPGPSLGQQVDLIRLLPAILTVVLCLTVVQAITEEIVCRGWMLQAPGTRSPWPGILLQAAVFTSLHGLDGTPTGYLHPIAYALLTGWLTVATGGIEAAAALHIVWNSTLAALTVSLTMITGVYPGHESVVTAPWQLTVIHLLGTAGFAAVVLFIARRASREPTRTTAVADT